MTPQPRKYHDDRDFTAMQALVMNGRAAGIPAHYPHLGDLGWWYFYRLPEDELRPYTYLVDDPDHPSRLLAWALLDSQWGTLDVFTQPELWETSFHTEILAWAKEQAEPLARNNGKTSIRTMWVSEQDAWLRRTLEAQGFHSATSGSVCLEISLETFPPEPSLPPGFRVCPVSDDSRIETRARAQYASFENEMPFVRYLDRYQRFRNSLVYDPQLDLMVLSPDGRAASFCICWVDPLNQVGEFEPVGTHPDFQRQGLGRAVMLAGLQRMRDRGMRQAIVSTGSQNTPAIKLYEAIGFRVRENLLTYEEGIRD